MICCVRLTENMMRSFQIAVELAMASTASTVDIEDGPILNEEMYIEIALKGLLVPLNLMVSWRSNCTLYTQLSQLGSIYQHF